MKMAEENNVLFGILAIILGILVIVFPLLTVLTASVLAGLAITFLAIWLLAQSFVTWSASKWASIAYLILGLIALILGIGLFGNILAFSFLASFWLYFVGIFLIISGIMALFTQEETIGKGVGGIGIILGILYIILGSFAWNPFYLAFLIGLWFILNGITVMFFDTPKLPAESEE